MTRPERQARPAALGPMAPAASIRGARVEEIPVLQEIERRAGAPFAAIDMAAVADDEPPAADTLRAFIADGRAWVWADANDTPVGYLVLGLVDGQPHIDQVSVDPAHAGNRIGKRLIDHAVSWAKACGLHTITLTTFTEVPWNGPYYARLGFTYIPRADESAALRAIRADEAANGLDTWPRACMRAEIETWRAG
ncbi:GNAT family N-acetyltransferase [Nocardia rhizosphaerae]|uniref:GNAT family N-acetyltransferase n=1 Tax=Nocardia rhizosphaerae TaxID=1691571 RepID=A0ABV8LB35_9NOCA